MNREEYIKLLSCYKACLDRTIKRIREHAECDNEEEFPFLHSLPLEIEGVKLICELRRTQHLLEKSTLRQCPFVERKSNAGGTLEFMVAPGDKSKGYKELRDFTRGAERVIVVDPYFYTVEKSAVSEHVEYLKKSLWIGNIRQLHVVYSAKQNGKTSAAQSALKIACIDAGCRYSEKHTNEIHDRIWIADRKRAVVVGTSFNGIGNRLSFILELPDADLNFLLEFLDAQGLS